MNREIAVKKIDPQQDRFSFLSTVTSIMSRDGTYFRGKLSPDSRVGGGKRHRINWAFVLSQTPRNTRVVLAVNSIYILP